MMTLEQMKVGMSDKVAEQVVDTFLRESEVLQMLPFDNTVSPSGGSTLTYSYIQTKLPSTADFRAIGSEYTGSEAQVEEKHAKLKVFGGKFGMDRVLKQAEGKYNNLEYQMKEKIRAAVSLFHYTLINGDSTTNEKEFDGLDKMLAGTTSEYNANGIIDFTDISKIKSNADFFYEKLQILITNTGANAILTNSDMIAKIQTVARILGYKTETEEAFGKKVMSMDGVRFMDLKNHYTVNEGIVTANKCVKTGIQRSNCSGVTDIYAVKFDVNNGFHGATLTGNAGIHTYLPDFNQPGAVKEGEVEMVAACVLKNTANAGVLRNIKLI